MFPVQQSNPFNLGPSNAGAFGSMSAEAPSNPQTNRALAVALQIAALVKASDLTVAEEVAALNIAGLLRSSER
jgi:hypothetical protein